MGVRVQLLRDQGLWFLLLDSRIEPEQSMLLATGPGTPVRGLRAHSVMGRWHAVHWAVVWGWGRPPQQELTFTSMDVRFRRQADAAARELGPAWLAVCEGAFAVAAVAAPPESERVLELAVPCR